MKKLIVYILWIITALGITYAWFQVIQWETILNGRLLLQWSGLAWDDIQNLQMRDTDSAAQKPTLTAISWSNIKTRCFDWGSQMNEMFGNVELPHDIYISGDAVLRPHIHRMWSTTETATWIWYLDYTIRKVWETYTTSPVKISITTDITARVANISEFGPDISLSWLALWDTISFRIYRIPTGNDTYGGLMCLSQIGFHYQRNTVGSRQEYIK